MNTDPIANYLTCIRNACSVNKRIVKIPFSKIKEKISHILYDQGFILNYKIEKNDSNHIFIKLALKYDRINHNSVIKYIKRISKPGLRSYCKSTNIPRVLNGLGIAIISTSQGIITDKEARKNKIGGEILCYVY